MLKVNLYEFFIHQSHEKISKFMKKIIRFFLNFCFEIQFFLNTFVKTQSKLINKVIHFNLSLLKKLYPGNSSSKMKNICVAVKKSTQKKKKSSCILTLRNGFSLSFEIYLFILLLLFESVKVPFYTCTRV